MQNKKDKVREIGYLGIFGAMIWQAIEDYQKFKNDRVGYISESNMTKDTIYRSAKNFLFDSTVENGLEMICKRCSLDIDIEFIRELAEGRKFNWSEPEPVDMTGLWKVGRNVEICL